jgi:uncharacterized pyridoxamine 5'-phosphate oxidase family protein
MIKKAFNFFAENRPFYLATLKWTVPRLRPMGFIMEYNNKIYFGVGTQKEVYAQMKKTPQVELCTTNKDGDWIRLSGKAIFDETQAAYDEAIAVFPPLKDMYPDGGPRMGLFYLEDPTCLILTTHGKVKETLEL